MKEKKKKSPTSKRSETGILSRCIPCSYWMSQWGQRRQQGRLPGTHTDASLAHAWLPVEQVSCLGSISTSEALESDSARITTRGRDPQHTWPPLNPPAPADLLPPCSWGRGASQEEEMWRKEKPELSHPIWFPTSRFQGGAGFRLDAPALFDIQVAQCPWRVVYTNLLDHTEQTCSVHTPACKTPRFFGSK